MIASCKAFIIDGSGAILGEPTEKSIVVFPVRFM